MLSVNIPKILPGELAYSYAKHIAQANELSEKDLLVRALNSKERCIKPKKVELLAELAGMSSQDFVCLHTAKPFYGAFEHDPARILPHGVNERNWHPKANILDISHRLRFCAQCARTDIDVWGRSYWRRHHQIPGVCWCQKHHTPLRIAPYRMFSSAFPHEIIDISEQYISASFPTKSSITSNYLKLVDFVLGLKHPIDIRAIGAALRRLLTDSGIAWRANDCRQKFISDRVAENCVLEWLECIYDDLWRKRPRSYFFPIDSIQLLPDLRAATYLLKLAVLFDNPDDAANEIASLAV